MFSRLFAYHNPFICST